MENAKRCGWWRHGIGTGRFLSFRLARRFHKLPLDLASLDFDLARLLIGGFWGLILSVKVLMDLGGFWLVVLGFLMFPLTFAILPFYAGFALHDWTIWQISARTFLAALVLIALGAWIGKWTSAAK